MYIHSLPPRVVTSRCVFRINLITKSSHPPYSVAQIILHPKWGSSVYPASIFAKAPLAAVTAAIDDAVAALKDRL